MIKSKTIMHNITQISLTIFLLYNIFLNILFPIKCYVYGGNIDKFDIVYNILPNGFS